ncbi:hypothetical protein NPIL_243241 [Nephila pilipes]|uniref:Uncharacterized protein n=1 Tax=Nephila pilipes TaxID=299642 RepID=A0A8X6P9H6_NEPPI|nr:hypothetical protein NPIL_243241 [Nephila pilipes]
MFVRNGRIQRYHQFQNRSHRKDLGLPKPKSAIFYVFASQKSPKGGNYTILVQGDAASHFLSVLFVASRSEPWFQFEPQNQGNMETGVSSGFVSQQWGRVTPQITRTEKLFPTLPQSSPDAP